MLSFILFLASVFVGLNFGSFIHTKFGLWSLICAIPGFALGFYTLITLWTVLRVIRIKWPELYTVIEYSIFVHFFAAISMLINMLLNKNNVWISLVAVAILSLTCSKNEWLTRLSNREGTSIASADEGIRAELKPNGIISKVITYILIAALTIETLYISSVMIASDVMFTPVYIVVLVVTVGLGVLLHRKMFR